MDLTCGYVNRAVSKRCRGIKDLPVPIAFSGDSSLDLGFGLRRAHDAGKIAGKSFACCLGYLTILRKRKVLIVGSCNRTRRWSGSASSAGDAR